LLFALVRLRFSSMPADSKPNPLYENLDTTFVNLWSLLRSLSQKGFVGRVHVELQDYSADIFMTGSSTPLVHEIDRAAGTDTLEEAALHRVVLRTRETPGRISVFEGADEAVAVDADISSAEASSVAASATPSINQAEANAEHVEIEESTTIPVISEAADLFDFHAELSEDIYPTGSYKDWPAILSTTGELIGAVERAVTASGENFSSLLAAIRLELADDYSFLDPIAKAFDYENGAATLKQEMPVSIFVAALSETLRRIVNRVAVGDRARRVRERVALEMLPVARMRTDVLDRSGFQSQLDRIAGTKVM